MESEFELSSPTRAWLEADNLELPAPTEETQRVLESIILDESRQWPDAITLLRLAKKHDKKIADPEVSIWELMHETGLVEPQRPDAKQAAAIQAAIHGAAIYHRSNFITHRGSEQPGIKTKLHELRTLTQPYENTTLLGAAQRLYELYPSHHNRDNETIIRLLVLGVVTSQTVQPDDISEPPIDSSAT